MKFYPMCFKIIERKHFYAPAMTMARPFNIIPVRMSVKRRPLSKSNTFDQIL